MNADRVKKLIHIAMTANPDEIRAAKAWIDEQERLLKLAEQKIADLLKTNHEEVDEFNAGYEAYKAGLDLEDSERMYVSIHYEVGTPNYDTFSTGYAWAKFQTERTALNTESEGKG
jgi:hypothetical protein